MICKKDLIAWFKELESYKRIDTMCTLLSMCLPFELRFLGTCLEELGRRDSQELRGMELRVNNAQDLAIDMGACQKGEPTDMKIRRKMALYLALIRACNRTCTTSTEIFRTLDVWGDREFQNMNDMDTLQELLLVYTMAAHHPVFTFEQQRRCFEVFERIKKNKLVSDPEPTPPSTQQAISQLPHTQMEMSTSPLPTGQLQHELRQTIPPHLPHHQEILQTHTLHPMHLPGQHPQLLSCPTPISFLSPGALPLGFHPQIPVDAIQNMNISNSIPADSNALLAHPNAPWPPRPFPPPPGPQSMEHPPQSSSPMLSQQSSPSSSRTTSPSRGPTTNVLQQSLQQTQQQVRVSQRLGGSSLKNVRRPSAETTPPPMAQMMSSEINLKHIEDVGMNSDNSGTQLQTLIRNGYTRSAHHTRHKSQSAYIQQQQQQSPVGQHYQAIPAGNYTGLSYTMHGLTLNDPVTGTMHMSVDTGMVGMNSNKSTGSESGSPINSSGEISPPETPNIMTNSTSSTGGHRLGGNEHQQSKHHHQQQVVYKHMSMGRLNGGRGEKVHGISGPISSSPTIIYAPAVTYTNAPIQQQTQPQFADIILAPGGNAGAVGTSNLMQATTLGSNNNSLGDVVSSSSSNSSINTGATLLISTPASTQSTSVQQGPQHTTSYPFHGAQHLTATTRQPPPPPLIAHTPAGMPHPPGTFRFPLAPNGELIYPTPYHHNIAFLTATGASATGAPPPPAVALRAGTTVSGGVVPANTTASTQLQQLQQAQTGAALLTVSPYSALSLGGGTGTTGGTSMLPKPISCYNCGSQAHSGRDCPEASMDDVTRSSVYKLDYSVSSGSSATGTSTAPGNSSGSSSSSSNNPNNADNATVAQQKTENMLSSTSSTASLTSTASTAAAVSNTK